MDGSKSQKTTLAVSGIFKLAHPIDAPMLPFSSLADASTQRVLSVDAVMDVASAILWPEPGHEQHVEIDNVDAARAQEYLLLATLLARAPDAAMLSQIAKLHCDETPLGSAHLPLTQAASNASAEIIEREFFDLFIGVGRGELMPYGSYYLTGFLNERPLARLRRDLGKLGIERTDGNAEPEDHAATLCEIMAGLANGRFGVPADSDRHIFEKHLVPWMGRFFTDLERADAARFYRSVGTIGRLFMDIETEAFAFS